ncbi:hypothetical protein LSH36_520g01091 [Paralvinella palmiformis]|uniref:Uncharacterized protein n=1 Tax=Paralvinella palmiformis TaxID=53620 RepID=A0AAD9MY52_9ANNE|nr:hypothetical protein LSH36_520g01091 [Paralvinella palmiformis]
MRECYVVILGMRPTVWRVFIY